MYNTSNNTNPYKVVLRGGITIQRIARKVGADTYHSKDWYMRAQVNGRRSWIKLGRDLKKATAKACETATALGAGGITAQLGFESSKTKQPRINVATLGELVDGIKLSAGVFDKAVANTVHAYLLSLILIVREVTQHKLGREVSDAEILALPASYLSAALVREFRNLRITGVPEGPKAKSARLTANRHLRNAQAALSPSVMDHLREKGMNIPDFTPFRSSPLFKNLRTVYAPPPPEIIVGVAKDIRSELPSHANPLFYPAALLAEQGGLRRNEMVHAKWSWFEPSSQPVIHVMEGPGFTPKGNRSRRIKITRWVYNELQKYKRADSEYILAGPSRAVVYEELDGLVEWLHLKGIVSEKPIHELRKLFGAFLAGYYDLTVAQRQLGHSTPLITNDFYAGIDHFNYALAKIWEEPELTDSLEELLAQVAAANDGEVVHRPESAFGFRRFQ